jgi:hypothetical protein
MLKYKLSPSVTASYNPPAVVSLFSRREAAHVFLLLRRGSDACLQRALRGSFIPPQGWVAENKF